MASLSLFLSLSLSLNAKPLFHTSLTSLKAGMIVFPQQSFTVNTSAVNIWKIPLWEPHYFFFSKLQCDKAIDPNGCDPPLLHSLTMDVTHPQLESVQPKRLFGRHKATLFQIAPRWAATSWLATGCTDFMKVMAGSTRRYQWPYTSGVGYLWYLTMKDFETNMFADTWKSNCFTGPPGALLPRLW